MQDRGYMGQQGQGADSASLCLVSSNCFAWGQGCMHAHRLHSVRLQQRGHVMCLRQTWWSAAVGRWQGWAWSGDVCRLHSVSQHMQGANWHLRLSERFAQHGAQK